MNIFFLQSQQNILIDQIKKEDNIGYHLMKKKENLITNFTLFLAVHQTSGYFIIN
jgi:hypothetical protein